jgi:hypothetical protein
MNRLTWLLTDPGGFLVDLLYPPGFVESEAGAHLSVTLGLVFWIVLLLAARLAWPRFGPAVMRAGRYGTQRGLRGLGSLSAMRGRWSWPVAWGAVWRAEAVHLGLVALLPAALETARVAAFVLFLPFSLMGVGEKRGLYEGTFDHLHRPVCWTFVSWCPSPSAEFAGVSWIEESRCRLQGGCPPAAPRLLGDRYASVWRLAWAVITLTWIVAWHRRRRPRARAAS